MIAAVTMLTAAIAVTVACLALVSALAKTIEDDHDELPHGDVAHLPAGVIAPLHNADLIHRRCPNQDARGRGDAA